MEKNFQRAKSKENKQIRMNEIMAVTDSLFHTHTYHEITLTTIAKELDMARGNLYKYVMSKEEIFLQIYLQKQKETIEMMMLLLEKEKTITIPILSRVMSVTLNSKFDYIKYHQILNAIIETNVSVEKLADFKLNSYKVREPFFQIIKKTCHLSTLQQATDLYLSILYHSCYLYDRVAYHNAYTKAMELADLPIVPLDFVESLNQFTTMCLTYYFS